jgi:NAD(P)-dependent dehydrogenase (short-subunit alcohol dehydrogenase family)
VTEIITRQFNALSYGSAAAPDVADERRSLKERFKRVGPRKGAFLFWETCYGSEGKVVAVTGGGNGIGRALCERFAAEGAAHVVVLDLEAGCGAGCGRGMGGSAHAVDVRSEAQIKGAVDAILAARGHIDLFCSNAGIIATDGPPWWASSAPNETWQAMWEIHVMSHVWAARACLPSMIERGEGYFLNTASAAGLLNQIGDAAYSTTKHAAVGFAEALAITHGDDGIRVSCLCPQAVATRMIGAWKMVERPVSMA